MASTVTIRDTRVEGNKKKVNASVNLATHATGGVAVTAGQFGMNTIEELEFQDQGTYHADVGLLLCYFDKANGKIIGYKQDGTTKLYVDAGAVSLANYAIRVTAIGF